MAHDLGFNRTSKVSLFDVPSMVSLLEEKSLRGPRVTEAFPYTQCKNMHKEYDEAYWFNLNRLKHFIVVFSACGGFLTGIAMLVLTAYFLLYWLRASWERVDCS